MTEQTESRCKIRKTGGLARIIGIGLFGGMTMLGGCNAKGQDYINDSLGAMANSPLLSPKYRMNAAASAANRGWAARDNAAAEQREDAQRRAPEQASQNNYEQPKREQDVLFACTRIENTNANGRIELGNFKDVKSELSVTNNLVLGAKIINYENHPVKLKFIIGKVLEYNGDGSFLHSNECTGEYDLPAHQGVIYPMEFNKPLSAGKYALIVEKDAKTDKVEFVDVK